MWGKWTYREIEPFERLVLVSSFSDAEGRITRHPLSTSWPLETLSTTTFEEKNGKTTITIHWTPLYATNLELKTFDEAHASMRQGWGGTFGQLASYLKGEMSDTADREIVITRVLDAPRELVWEAITNPQHVVHWWGPDGFTNTLGRMDFRVGGVWEHIMHGPDGTNYPNKSTFTAIAKPEHIEYSHGGGHKGDHAAHYDATWTFEALGNRTRVTLRWIFPTADARDTAVKAYNAMEGGKQTQARLDDYLQEMKRLMQNTGGSAQSTSLEKGTVMQLNPYLFFEGRCEEAIEFYRTALGAEVATLMRYKESPDPQPPGMLPPGSEDKVMHMSFRIGDITVFASDGMCSGKPDFKGVSLTLTVKNDAEAERIFAALSNGGQVQMPMATTFFASRFGMVADRFGVSWMIIVML
jgi:PhnB protein